MMCAMQKGHQLEFDCQCCQKPVSFSVFELNDPVNCEHCEQTYALGDAVLKRQLQKFTALCKQLIESEEILSNTSVGIDIGEHHVQIPYKILLTRLNPELDLVTGDHPLTIRFRIEPVKDAKTVLK